MAVDNVANGSVEHGIAEELQSLVVHGLALRIALVHALVHQREFVIANVVWVEAYDFA